MTPLKVIVSILLSVTFDLSSGKEVAFDLTADGDMICSFDGSSKNKYIMQMSIAAIMDSSEEILAVLEENSDQVDTGNATEIKATGTISGMKGFLRLTMKENLDVLKYACRVLVNDSNHNVETIESFKENKGSGVKPNMNHLLGDQMKKTEDEIEKRVNEALKNNEEKDDMRTEKSEEKILELMRQLVEETEEDIKEEIGERVEQTVKQSETELKKTLFRLIGSIGTGCNHIGAGSKTIAPSRKIITNSYGIKLLCDTETDGGGWIVFQKRPFDDTLNFDRTWLEYENGFGTLESSFWLGLKLLSEIVAVGKWELRVDMLYGPHRKHIYAKYSHFTIGDQSTNYKLYVSGYSGNKGDGFAIHNNMPFSTKDRDHVFWDEGNCAKTYRSGWWYITNHCMLNKASHLNGGPESFSWYETGYLAEYTTEMKIRRVD